MYKRRLTIPRKQELHTQLHTKQRNFTKGVIFILSTEVHEFSKYKQLYYLSRVMYEID